MIHNSLATADAKASSIKAFGAIVKVDSAVFMSIVGKVNDPLVIRAQEKIFTRVVNKYLTTYKGLIFYTETRENLSLPAAAEIMKAERILIPTS